MPARKTPPEAWIDAALTALAEGGPNAIRIEALASSLGVTKGGFYGEFADRNALVERALDTWEHAVVDDVIARIENTDDDARTKLRHLFSLARDHARAGQGLAVELAIRDWARRSPGVSERLHRVDNRRMAYLRALFRQISVDDNDAEARSLLAFSLFVGDSLITAEHDGHPRREVVGHALDRLLSSSWH
ncbi:TetR/AcrR family transcriptional regulator [Mycobacterium sp.]|uniref:TetR/AcrR family transcriptional regulator n=1 Tax=Mycobacterium sp. TaxID=1785 RepID=UPI003F95A1F3